jgi:hypothetical protein
MVPIGAVSQIAPSSLETCAVPVACARVHKAWPHIAEWVSDALVRGYSDLSANDILRHLESGSMQLWLAWVGDRPRGVCITELLESVRGRFCNIVVIAGEDFGAWAHLEEDIARWALDWKCVRLCLTGRKGWVRRLAPIGWSETAVTLEKAIGDG